jgi:hypothetical protein
LIAPIGGNRPQSPCIGVKKLLLGGNKAPNLPGRGGQGIFARMKDPEAIKVLIVNEDGQYLAGTAAHWEFTDDRSLAKVFDYSEDRVAEQIRLVRRVYGKVWVAVQLDPGEAFEFCDRCGGRMSAVEAFFDGKRFLCQDCRTFSEAPVYDRAE